MPTTQDNIYHSGLFSRLKSRLQNNRLGELLVQDGKITDSDLSHALWISKESGQQLGKVLVSQSYVTSVTIRRTLFEQVALRCVMGAVAVFISMASMGITKQARAGQIQDATTRISLTDVSFTSVKHYPKLFGSTEKKSRSLKAFTKWTSMFKRFNASLNSAHGQGEMADLKRQIAGLQGLPLHQMATQVNNIINQNRYITDKRNYGQNDYWATPVEFFQKGGDCEDFAIAKYTALRMLGVPENRLRIAIVQDQQKNIPHAVLIVYTDQGGMILDNQIKRATYENRISHYKPIFSINQKAWWLHTAPKNNVTVIASAR